MAVPRYLIKFMYRLECTHRSLYDDIALSGIENDKRFFAYWRTSLTLLYPLLFAKQFGRRTCY